MKSEQSRGTAPHGPDLQTRKKMSQNKQHVTDMGGRVSRRGWAPTAWGAGAV